MGWFMYSLVFIHPENGQYLPRCRCGIFRNNANNRVSMHAYDMSFGALLQAGSDSSDWVTAAASQQTVAGSQRVILAGSTKGKWDPVFDGDRNEDYLMISLNVGTVVDATPTPAATPVPTLLAPTPVPTSPVIAVLPPELPATPAPSQTSPVIVVLPPELPATPAPTRMTVVNPEHNTPAPTPAPRELSTVVASIMAYMAVGVVALSFGAICFTLLLAHCTTRKEENREGDPRTAAIPSRLKSMCKNLILAGLALLPPIDVVSDIYVILDYWLDWHPMWASFLTVVFVLSCRFVVVFAVFHPPPEAKVLPLLYIFPFRVAFKHKLAVLEQAADAPDELSKTGVKNAEMILGSCLPTRLRTLLKVRRR